MRVSYFSPSHLQLSTVTYPSGKYTGNENTLGIDLENLVPGKSPRG